MARALASSGVDVVRVALKRGRTTPDTPDATRFPREEGARALRAFVRRPFRALGQLLRLVLRAGGGNKEGGRAGAVLAWRDGLALADWARRLEGPVRFHAQFASWEATSALVAACVTRTPFSFEVHNPFTFVRGRSLLRMKLLAADRITAISDDARRRALALAPEAASRLVLVRCGLDLDGVPARAGRGPDVVAVGSLVPRKGHDVLVEAVARVAATRPGLAAAIVGEGPERERLAALIRERHAPVTLVGALPEARAWTLAASAKVCVLACRTAADGDEDGIPVALMEAMAAGTPVISTPVGGIAELLDDGRAGLLVPAGDALGLATAIERLLDDGPLRERLARDGRAAVAARHDLVQCARDLANALGVPRSTGATA
jgi:glycosyltransferase involved in cell wall biosynthesis